MALELQHYKTCPRCSNTYPASTKYFHRAGESGLSCYCKECKREHMRLWRSKKRQANEQPKPKVIQSITPKQIEPIKQKFPEGKRIEIIENSQRIRGKVTRHYKHFMTVQAKYPTTVLYKDILIGEVWVNG